jgi:hypothetical protein
MNNVIFCWKGNVWHIPLNAAHMAVKGYRWQIIGIAPTEKLISAFLATIFDDGIKGASA